MRGPRLLAPVLALVLLLVALLADRSLSGQAAAEAAGAAARIDDEARLAAAAFEAALRTLEAVPGVRPNGVRVERLAIPPGLSLPPPGFVPYAARSRAELTQLLDSTRGTPNGLPEAVVARLALGPTAISGPGDAAKEVESRLLAGELPVRADDLPLLARRLGLTGDRRITALAARLRSAPPPPWLLEHPAHRRRLLGEDRIESWSRSAAGWLQRSEVPLELPLQAVNTASRAVARAPRPEAAAGPARVVAVPEVPGLLLRVEARLRGRLRLDALRAVLWAAAVAGLLALAGLQRAHAREARAARRERAFLAGVTHELRTPVTAIRVLGETLAEGRGDPREYGELVARESERLEALVEQVLTATRVDLVPRFAPVLPGELLRSALALAAPRAQRSGASVEACNAGELPECRWDADAVRRALLNLIENAVVHGRPAGRVTVSARAEGSWVTLSVADDGPGVGHGDRQRIFRRFERGHTDAAGTGLGLYLVDQVARAHGGHVDLVTAEGRGATFSMVLPVEPRAAAASGAGPAAVAASAGERAS